uniref:Uncharacterized protein n=1 Tax=Sphaerodactylus townsendi TaxID=933632 RepID=A0ACB8F6N0_9SAUR
MPARPWWPVAVGLGWLLVAASGAEGGCAELGQCCPGRSLACVSSGWRPDGSHGPCFCDRACRDTLDCCHDYREVCPGMSYLLLAIKLP